MAGKCLLIMGGARSGKSRLAQEIALQLGGKVIFVATGEALDEEMKQRIEEHKKNRPSDWRTIETPVDAGKRITEEIGDAQIVILDCLTLLLSNVMSKCAGEDMEKADYSLLEEQVDSEIQGLIKCMDSTSATFIIVSNEVGTGLVPADRAGRFYRDLLGKVNQMLAQRADEVYFMLAGIPVEVKTLARGGGV